MKPSKSLLLLLVSSIVFLSGCEILGKKVTPNSEVTQDHAHNDIDYAAMITSEEEYLRHMVPHHQEAVETSQLLLTQSADPELTSIAQSIISAQTAEIATLQNWISTWYPDGNLQNPYQRMMGDLTVLSGSDLETAYAQGMIHHHQSAVRMSQAVLTLEIKPETKMFAEAVIVTQTEEIEALNDWLASKDARVMPVEAASTTE